MDWCVVDIADAVDEGADDTREKDLECGQCRVGDQVSAPRAYGLYHHHGVLLPGDQVLHVNAGPFDGVRVCLGLRPAMMRVDPVARFLKGAPALHRVAESFDGGDTARRMARAAGTPVEYNLFLNNCETHAASMAGHPPRSHQSRRVAGVVLVATGGWVAGPVGALGAAAIVGAYLAVAG